MTFPRATKKNAGYHLRVWRAERDLSIAQAATVFGIGSSMLSLLESGYRNASPQVAAKLAKATRQPIELFLGIPVTR